MIEVFAIHYVDLDLTDYSIFKNEQLVITLSENHDKSGFNINNPYHLDKEYDYVLRQAREIPLSTNSKRYSIVDLTPEILDIVASTNNIPAYLTLKAS
jgi:flagellar assembly factor FliW